jgi:hypothetical protein
MEFKKRFWWTSFPFFSDSMMEYDFVVDVNVDDGVVVAYSYFDRFLNHLISWS